MINGDFSTTSHRYQRPRFSPLGIFSIKSLISFGILVYIWYFFVVVCCISGVYGTCLLTRYHLLFPVISLASLDVFVGRLVGLCFVIGKGCMKSQWKEGVGSVLYAAEGVLLDGWFGLSKK